MFYGVLREAEESVYNKDQALKELKSNISKSISKIKNTLKNKNVFLTSRDVLNILLKGYTNLQKKVNAITNEDGEDKVKKLEKSFDSLENKKDKVYKVLRIRSNMVSGAKRFIKGK